MYLVTIHSLLEIQSFIISQINHHDKYKLAKI